MKASDLLKFYEQYKIDKQEGFVSNIRTYVENKLKGLSIEQINEIIEELEKINKDESRN